MDEQEKAKKSIKINTIIICILVILLLISVIIFIVTISLSGVRVENNLSNLGMICFGEDKYFYTKYMDGIYKIVNNEETKLSSDQAYSLSYNDSYIYYTVPNNNGGIDIKKVKDSGDEEAKILKSVSSSSTKMYLDNGYLYYITVNPDTISRIDLNGENEKTLINRTAIDFDVNNEKIYFVDNNNSFANIDINGENYSEINNDFSAEKFQIYNGKVYYYIENKGLMRASLKNYEEELLSDKVNSNIYNVTNKGIFYLDTEKLNICKISLNGKNYKELVSVNTNNSKINVLKDDIYYLDIDKDSESYRTYRVNLNGKVVNEIKY